MNETISFQEVIEYVENLSQEDQDFLVELIKKRKIEKRRLEIAKNAEQTLAALSAGTAKKGTVADLLKTKKPFPVTKLEDVAGCLKYDGEPVKLEDMEDAIRQAVEEIFTNSSSNVAD